jgi:hypothetical protein
MLQNYATIPLYTTHKNVTFCHEGTGVQKGFLVAACLLACSLFKHPGRKTKSWHSRFDVTFLVICGLKQRIILTH